ncbi:hypothetical protein GQ57_24385 [Burkholderia sp. MSh2]|uniref:LuxR family transcriptional regulator n=1 Tax=Burkholderia paludis TaxID=1506587 RepID=A0A6J5DAV5_9BURK|nr:MULTISPECIES: LuxR C-terminal-related transcriptional regulator [Burkholderia]KEZ03437.1 hypothetical protein GQ57_24385 [Burkholderia sp. MSh2]KFG95209.1 hypothetical protein GQ56_0121525 [Burkholderia paludis]CAB3751389.1 hypothetical protein LMG30113_01468 [Burkholderia paludis]VWB06939.1 LuxR family transcriptional regulator [Burkholderia paludis]
MKVEILDDLLSKIYDTAHDASLWHIALAALCRMMEVESGALLYVPLQGSAGQPIEITYGTPDDAFRRLTNTLSRGRGCGPLEYIGPQGEVVRFDVQSGGDGQGLPWLVGPTSGRDVGQLLLAVFSWNDAFVGAIGFKTRVRGEPFSHGETQLLSLLLPHIRRAHELKARFEDIVGVNETALLALGRLSYGAALLASSGEVIRTNNEADRICTASDGISISQRRLRCVDVESDRSLAETLRRTVFRSGGDSAKAVLISRPSGKRPYIAWSVPVEHARPDASRSPAYTMIIINDLERPKNNLHALHELYELTPCEADIAIALGTGAEVSHVAQSRRVSVNTVRSQRAQIYAKLGISSQSELIRTLAALPQQEMQRWQAT